MTSSGGSSEPTLEQRIRMTNSFHSFLHNTSLAMLVLAPVLIAIPPRKLDLYTLFLSGSFVVSVNHLVKERTGAGLLHQLPGARLPPMAEEYRARAREQERERGQAPTKSRILEEAQSSARLQHREPAGLEKVAKDIWMGGEEEGWKERRLREEQEKIDKGEGYGSMIMDQIWDVWTWGEKKAEGLKEKDKQVVSKEAKEKRRAEEFPEIGKQR